MLRSTPEEASPNDDVEDRVKGEKTHRALPEARRDEFSNLDK